MVKVLMDLSEHHQLGIFNSVTPGLNVNLEERVLTDVRVCGAVQGDARSYGRALGDLDWDDGSGELGGIVVDVQHFHFDVEQLKVLGREREHVELDGAVEILFAEFLAVDFASDADFSVLLAHGEEGRTASLHGSKAERHGAGKFCQNIRDIVFQTGNNRADFLLLRNVIFKRFTEGRGKITFGVG
uniref:Uncharacterized protein n=1 Tax=Oryzias latipes TaxID=8090 RepID=A0A3P9JR25_ORYLA